MVRYVSIEERVDKDLERRSTKMICVTVEIREGALTRRARISQREAA